MMLSSYWRYRFLLAAAVALSLSMVTAQAGSAPISPILGRPVYQLGVGAVLDVPLYGQQTNVWCWDASSLMVIKYFRPSSRLRECDLAGWPLQDCCIHPIPGCAHGGGEQLYRNGFTFDSTANAAISWNTLVEQISTRHTPVLYGIGWNGGGGHMLVAVGWFSLMGRNWVLVNDPWPPPSSPSIGPPYTGGGHESLTYEAWVGGPGYDHVTNDDYYNITDLGAIRIPYLPQAPFVATLTNPIGPDPMTQTLAAPQTTRVAIQTLAQIRTAPPALALELGFARASDTANATLGTPLREYAVGLDVLQRYVSDMSASRVLTGGTTLFYPIVANGVIRSSVRVSELSNRAPELLSIGDTGTAQRLEQLEESAPLARRRSDTSIPAVRIPALGLYFVGHVSGGVFQIASLFDVPAYGLVQGRFETLDAVLTRLAPVARRITGAM